MEDAICTDYVQICHPHKSTAARGFTFLHVTSNAFLSVSACFTASVQLLTAAEEGHPSPSLLHRDVTFHVMLPECLLGANWKASSPPYKVLSEPWILAHPSEEDYPSSSLVFISFPPHQEAGYVRVFVYLCVWGVQEYPTMGTKCPDEDEATRAKNIRNPCPCGDIFFGLPEENSLLIIQNYVFWKNKNAESLR